MNLMSMTMYIIVSMLLLMIMLSIYYNMFMLMKINLMNMLSLSISIDFMMDWMSIMFLTTVIMISSTIIIFSKYYIPNLEQKQFLLLLLMFVLSMSILIISNNLFLMLLGWDGLGLSSYMLVIYYQNPSSAASGTITILSNRVGDILILLSMSMILMSSNWNFNLNKEFSMMTMLLLMIAGCTKSAQFPFSAWLPMAMAAPTPISALVHSSTLVTAGVFLLLRIMNYIHPITMIMLMMIASSTAIYASMSANWEQDLKKIIALSTLSQIAMMMFAISLNSMILAFMHLIIHALFKSAMFLCAGIMIHESSYQDMRMMGLNFTNSPLTPSILGINSMALMGIPFMSGFFSKDAIIESLITSKFNMIMFILMILSIGMTAAYSIRMSLSSNSSTIKFFPFMSNHQNIQSYFPIIILSLLAITSGSWMNWLLSPDNTFMMSYMYKMIILMILTTGLLLGFSLQFKNNLYMKMGMSSIMLWFTHILSTFPSFILSPLMHIFHNNDKNWQEMYGPSNSHMLLTNMAYSPDLVKLSLLMILLMVIIIPLMFI